MKKKSTLLIAALFGFSSILVAGGAFAGTKSEDVITMENKAYASHTKPIVKFTHKKHQEELKIACGECHHDENNKPLDVKPGDDVKGCIECHKLPGKAPADAAKKLDYHAEAIHKNCVDCHKEAKAAGKGDPPTSCTKCHVAAGGAGAEAGAEK